MWLSLDLQGMKFELNIKNYIKNQNLDGKWADVSFHFEFQDIINYSTSDQEILLCCEVDELRDYMDALLNDKLEDVEKYTCIEPDFEFVFNPKFDMRNDPDVIYIRPGCEIMDISMDLIVNLWDGGLTINHFSTSFNREDIELFYLYLSLTTHKINKDDSRIKELIDLGIIYGNVR